MAAALKVDIVTPERSVFSGPASEIVLPAWEGQLGVLPDHDALLSLLRAGTCVVNVQGEGTQRWVIGRGFADIGGDHVTLLTDQAVPVDAIDRGAAQTLLAEALRDVDAHAGTELGKAAEIRAEWARALIDA